MLKTVQIKQKVSLESKYLDKNIKDHILKILKNSMYTYCTFSNGYIIDVKRIISLGENTISSANSLVVFNVTYEADILKPAIGDIMNGKVCMVLQNGDGIIVDICSKMQILIPAYNMKPFIYKTDCLSYELNNTKTKEIITISRDSNVSVEIIACKYEKKAYSCIGKLITII